MRWPNGRWMRTAFGGIADAFADANFRRYSVGAIVSWLSFFVQAVAVAWTAWELTHSTTWLAAIALLDAVPMSVLAPLGGVLVTATTAFASSCWPMASRRCRPPVSPPWRCRAP